MSNLRRRRTTRHRRFLRQPCRSIMVLPGNLKHAPATPPAAGTASCGSDGFPPAAASWADRRRVPSSTHQRSSKVLLPRVQTVCYEWLTLRAALPRFVCMHLKCSYRPSRDIPSHSPLKLSLRFVYATSAFLFILTTLSILPSFVVAKQPCDESQLIADFHFCVRPEILSTYTDSVKDRMNAHNTLIFFTRMGYTTGQARKIMARCLVSNGLDIARLSNCDDIELRRAGIWAFPNER